MSATTTTPTSRLPQAGHDPADGLPPGPPLPRVVQMLAFALSAPRFLNACQRRYGTAVTLRTPFDSGFVMVFDPTLVKEVFQGRPEQLHAGEANRLLGPILGERSVLLLDRGEHLRHRRLMLPPFHGRRMQGYAQTMREAADVEIDSWPVGEPFALMSSMQTLTLRVIVRAVFGYESGPEEQELRRRLREMIMPAARARGLFLIAAPMRLRRRSALVEQFEAAKRAVDSLLYAEIARRRQDPELELRDDVFSALLLAEDEHGERLSDREVRDELVTLLVAGHETTATGLAWTFDLLLHAPEVLARCDPRDEAYLDAVVKEALRIRPVIPAVGRVVRDEPFRLNGWTIPVGMEINPSIRTIHRRADLYPDPEAFRPERFLGEDAPDTYTWLPFGGGTRRCLGASFAHMEMRIVLERVLERAQLRAADPKREKIEFRGITLAPRNEVQVVLERPPAPATDPPAPAADPPAPAAQV